VTRYHLIDFYRRGSIAHRHDLRVVLPLRVFLEMRSTRRVGYVEEVAMLCSCMVVGIARGFAKLSARVCKLSFVISTFWKSSKASYDGFPGTCNLNSPSF
jgi:hypothetical protein